MSVICVKVGVAVGRLEMLPGLSGSVGVDDGPTVPGQSPLHCHRGIVPVVSCEDCLELIYCSSPAVLRGVKGKALLMGDVVLDDFLVEEGKGDIPILLRFPRHRRQSICF